MTVGIPFGDPRHPYKQTTEVARRAGLKGKAASPWGKGTLVVSKRAAKIFEEHAQKVSEQNKEKGS